MTKFASTTAAAAQALPGKLIIASPWSCAFVIAILVVFFLGSESLLTATTASLLATPPPPPSPLTSLPSSCMSYMDASLIIASVLTATTTSNINTRSAYQRSVALSNCKTFSLYNLFATGLIILLLPNSSLLTSYTGIKLKADSATPRRRQYNTTYSAVLGNEISLPCNITAPTLDDGVSLILWYRDDIASPIYTVDARQSISLDGAQHFLHRDIFQRRATFELSYPLSYLRIKPVNSSDNGDYRCRVDFRRARTVNRILKLSVIVPTTNVVIYDKHFKSIHQVAGPFDEDSNATLICDSSEGNPLPMVYWWKGQHLIDTDYFIVNNTIARNVLLMANLSRDDLLVSLTCQAYNTNLTVPVSKTISLDLNLKPKEVRIISPQQNITNLSGQTRIELACQCTGSKPPARIRWLKGSEPLETVPETSNEESLTTTSFLSLLPTLNDNGKVVVCICGNARLEDRHSIQDTWPINILYLPIVSLVMGSNSHSQEIIEGSSVYFECDIQANPSATMVLWRLNASPLTDKTGKAIEIRNTSLLVASVDASHYGHYQCQATNALGSNQSETVFLNVKYAPKCKRSKPVMVGVALYESVQVECHVTANPANDVRFEWKFNQTDSRSKMVIEAHANITRERTMSVAKFVINSEDDFGPLLCTARNAIGRQREPCVFHLVKAEPPSSPHNCTIVNKTTNSLTLECLPGSFGGLETIFSLEVYSLNPTRLLKNLSNPEAPYFAINDLPAGFIFKLATYATNRRGRSRTIEITGSTTIPSPWKSAEYDTSNDNLYALIVPVLLVIGLVILVLVSACFVFNRIRPRFQSTKRTTLVYNEKPSITPKSIMKKRNALENSLNVVDRASDMIEINDLGAYQLDYPRGCEDTFLESLTCMAAPLPPPPPLSSCEVSSSHLSLQPYYVPSPLELSVLRMNETTTTATTSPGSSSNWNSYPNNALPPPPSSEAPPPSMSLVGSTSTSYDLCPTVHIIDVHH